MLADALREFLLSFSDGSLAVTPSGTESLTLSVSIE